MKIFHCSNCELLVFFENVICVKCKHMLAYLPEQRSMVAMVEAGENRWRPVGKKAAYRLCENFVKENVCNWAIPEDDPNPYCRSCRLTRVIPDLSKGNNRANWFKLEIAKRRLIYSLIDLELPMATKDEDPECGLAFEFLADPDPTEKDAKPVLTGHANGLITINIAEADDAEREKRRVQMHEPARTLLGHFRHEIGHYYWDRLISDKPVIDEFRAAFGDEREDYGEALKTYYKNGPPEDWQDKFISIYASSHAWEDWAESWAHYLHMTDTLETANDSGLSLRPKRPDEPSLKPSAALTDLQPDSFDHMIEGWFSLTYLVNNLNRALGARDSYPFVLSDPVLKKLRFIHELIGR